MPSRFHTSYFKNTYSRFPEPFTSSWSEFSDFLQGVSTIARHPSNKSVSTPAISPAEFVPGKPRFRANVLRWHYLGFDIDNAASAGSYVSFQEMELILRMQGFNFVLHTTTNSSPDHHRYRLLLETDRPIEFGDIDHVWSAAFDLYGCIFDKATRDPSRILYVPATWAGSYNAFSACKDGHPLSIDRLLSRKTPAQTPIPAANIHPDRWLPLPAATRLSLDKRRLRSRWQCSAPNSGRFFRTMCSIAGSAKRMGYRISAPDLEGEALDVARSMGCNKPRPGSRKEAQNAIDFIYRA